MLIITGHKGFVGSRLHKKLPDAVGLDKKTGEWLDSCRLPDGVDTIYHLAALTSVAESWDHPLAYSYNFNMTVRLVHKYPKAKFIFAQSAAAEEHSSPYGFSKWASGEYIKKFHSNYVICTFPNLFGGGAGVVDIFKAQKKVIIYGDGQQIRDFVHVDDIVEGLIKAQNWPVGEYSMGSTVGTKIKDLALGKEVINAPARQEVRESVLRNTTPDWKPKRNVIDYLK